MIWYYFFYYIKNIWFWYFPLSQGNHIISLPVTVYLTHFQQEQRKLPPSYTTPRNSKNIKKKTLKQVLNWPSLMYLRYAWNSYTHISHIYFRRELFLFKNRFLSIYARDHHKIKIIFFWWTKAESEKGKRWECCILCFPVINHSYIRVL